VTAVSYMAKLGFDQAEIERRLRFYEITSVDLAQLVSLRAFAERICHPVIEDLYELILGDAQSAKFFTSPATVERVKEAQRAYLLGLFTGRIDAEYVEGRLRVGLTHARIGMPPTLYIGTYGRLLRTIHLYFSREISDPAELWRSYSSIEKRMRFDESLAVDTYIAARGDDQLEANSQMVGAALRAQDLAIEADAAKERAETSEQELRTVTEFREMFIGILGHDLRNPLGSIVMGSGMLLRRGHLDEQDEATVGRIVRASQRMTRMISQVLDLTRARLGGGLPIETQRTDLREVCQNAIEELEARVALTIDGDVTGNWDEDRLAEVLSNLLGNALEYASAGTTVLVRARADGPEVVVEIENEGPPIPEDVMPFIFEPFRRAKQKEKSATGNLGLGLYIAQQIVLAHHGTLSASSGGGKTRFTVRLPRNESSSAGGAPLSDS